MSNGGNNEKASSKVSEKGFRYLIVLHASLLIINILSSLNSYPMSCYSYMYKCMKITLRQPSAAKN